MRPRASTCVEPLSKVWRTRLDSSLAKAKAKLNSHSGQGPFVLAAPASKAVFDAWDDDSKAAWSIAYDALNQVILMYGDPATVHARTRGYISQRIVSACCFVAYDLAGIDPDNSTIEQRAQAHDAFPWPEGYGGTTMYTDRGAKSPDLSFYVGMVSSGRSLVVEVAHRNESFAALQEEVTWWHEAGVGLVLGIFVDVHSDSNDPILVLLSQSRDSSVMSEQQFGHGSGCTAADLSDFELQIPLGCLIDHTSQEVLCRCISMDLFKLQQRIIDWVKIMQ